MRRTVSVVVASLLLVGLLAGAAVAQGRPAPVSKMTFKLPSHTVTTGTPITGSVLLQTRSGNQWVAIAGATLSVFLDGAPAGTFVTDANGNATISVTPLTDGDHVISVVYAGDSTHKRCQRAQGFTSTPAA